MLPELKREPLDDDELDSLLEAASGMDLDHEFTVRTLAHTGLCADESAYLYSEWIDFLCCLILRRYRNLLIYRCFPCGRTIFTTTSPLLNASHHRQPIVENVNEQRMSL